MTGDDWMAPAVGTCQRSLPSARATPYTFLSLLPTTTRPFAMAGDETMLSFGENVHSALPLLASNAYSLFDPTTTAFDATAGVATILNPTGAFHRTAPVARSSA